MSYIQSTQAQGLFEFYAINIVTALTPQRLEYAYFSSKVPHARPHVTTKHKHQRFNITPYGCICTNILQQCSPFITFIVILILPSATSSQLRSTYCLAPLLGDRS